MQIGVGLSTAQEPPSAAAEATLLARDPLNGATPNLAVLLTSPHHALHAGAVLDIVQELAQPTALVGCVAEAVVAGRRELEREPAVVVWLAVLPQPAETFHAEFLRTPSGGLFGGYRFDHSRDLHLYCPIRTHFRPTFCFRISIPKIQALPSSAAWPAVPQNRGGPHCSATTRYWPLARSERGWSAYGRVLWCRRAADRSATHTL